MGSAWLRHTEEERGKINKAFEPEEKSEKQDWKGFQSHRLRNEWQTTYLMTTNTQSLKNKHMSYHVVNLTQYKFKWTQCINHCEIYFDLGISEKQ